jgi:AcrR family transcriptional regulator
LLLEPAVSIPSARPAARQERATSRQERILDAALDVFAERGYQQATVDDIAGVARTSKGGIYFHFPGKDAIFLALLDRSANLLLARVGERIGDEPDPIARVDAALSALVRTFGSHRALARLFLVEARGAGPKFHTRLAEVQARFVAFLRQQLDAAVSQGLIQPLDTDVASQAWFGALNQVVTTWALAVRPRPLDETYPHLRALLLRSIGLLESAAVPSQSPTRSSSDRPAQGVPPSSLEARP